MNVQAESLPQSAVVYYYVVRAPSSLTEIDLGLELEPQKLRSLSGHRAQRGLVAMLLQLRACILFLGRSIECETAVTAYNGNNSCISIQSLDVS